MMLIMGWVIWSASCHTCYGLNMYQFGLGMGGVLVYPLFFPLKPYLVSATTSDLGRSGNKDIWRCFLVQFTHLVNPDSQNNRTLENPTFGCRSLKTPVSRTGRFHDFLRSTRKVKGPNKKHLRLAMILWHTKFLLPNFPFVGRLSNHKNNPKETKFVELFGFGFVL